jgi:vacuolar iron transporter family protein
MTFLAFALAGAVPLLPYLAGVPGFHASALLTAAALFGVGAARTVVTTARWYTAGFEMLALGGLVAVAAYGAGTAAGSLIP